MESNKNLTYQITLILFLAKASFGFSQGMVQFASLKGAPIDTTGWIFRGTSALGNTTANVAFGSEVLLISRSQLYNQGHIYYNTPLKINTTCNQWKAEFDFRIFDGNSADGMSFYFVENPKADGLTGAAIGIPSSSSGLFILLDTYENCCSQGFNCPIVNTPKLELRNVTASTNPNNLECDTANGVTLKKYNSLRSSQYQTMEVSYQNDSVFVKINAIQVAKMYYPIRYDGYFGFSAANGGSFDTHSIKNVKITIPETNFTVNAGKDTILCTNQKWVLGGNSVTGFSYQWSPTTLIDNPISANPTFSTSIPGTYRLKLSGNPTQFTCVAEDIVTISVETPPLFSLAPFDTLICRNISLSPRFRLLSPTTLPGKNITWFPKQNIDTANIFKPKFTPSVSTKWYVQTTNLSGRCKSRDSISIKVDDLPLPVVQLPADTLLCENETLVLKNLNPSASGTQWLWSTGATTPQITITAPGVYRLSSKNANGCLGGADTIMTNPCPPEITHLPNIFTPNEDQHNDYFYIDTRNVDQYTLEITNRWGQRIFATTDKKERWAPKNLPDGIYFYTIKYNGLGVFETMKEKKGYLQVAK